MSEIKVHVEGAPIAVAEFFREMGKAKYPLSSLFASRNDILKEHDSRIYDTGSFDGEVPPFHEIPCGEGTTNVLIEPRDLAPEEMIQEADLNEHTESLKAKAQEYAEKPRRGRPRKETPPPVADPDPEFAELPDQTPLEQTGDSGELESPEPSAPEPEKPKLTLPQVQAALKEYGIWATEQGHDAPSVKPYLIALLRKYGNGANGTAELKEADWQAVFDAAVSRVPLTELEEFR